MKNFKMSIGCIIQIMCLTGLIYLSSTSQNSFKKKIDFQHCQRTQDCTLSCSMGKKNHTGYHYSLQAQKKSLQFSSEGGIHNNLVRRVFCSESTIISVSRFDISKKSYQNRVLNFPQKLFVSLHFFYTVKSTFVLRIKRS